MNTFVAFIMGLLIGNFVGFFLMGLCVIAREADERSERYYKEHQNDEFKT